MLNEHQKRLEKEWMEMYNLQKRAIDDIKDTEGYKVIMNFFQTQLDNIELKIDNSKDKEEIYNLVLERKPIKQLLIFLQNITKE